MVLVDRVDETYVNVIMMIESQRIVWRNERNHNYFITEIFSLYLKKIFID